MNSTNESSPDLKRQTSESPFDTFTASVRFVSPIVLRKDIEEYYNNFITRNPSTFNLFTNNPLTSPFLVDEYPQLFWNLYYLFNRISFKHKLHSLLYQSKTFQKFLNHFYIRSAKMLQLDSVEKLPRAVTCRFMCSMRWDLLDLSLDQSFYDNCDPPKCMPIFMIYYNYVVLKCSDNDLNLITNCGIDERELETYIESIKMMDCVSPCLKLLQRLPKYPNRRSIYRELLFLIYTAFPSINIGSMDDTFNRKVKEWNDENLDFARKDESIRVLERADFPPEFKARLFYNKFYNLNYQKGLDLV